MDKHQVLNCPLKVKRWTKIVFFLWYDRMMEDSFDSSFKFDLQRHRLKKKQKSQAQMPDEGA